MNKVRLPPLIEEFLQSQAIILPKFARPIPPKSIPVLINPIWLAASAISLMAFQITIIASSTQQLHHWLVVGLSVLLIGLGGLGGWWWFESVYQQVKRKRLKESYLEQNQSKYSYQKYRQAEKLLERQQHRKLRQLLSGKLPKLITSSTGTPEEKKVKVRLKKTFPFLQVKHRVKFLMKKEWVELEWVIISERTKVFLGVFFEDEEKDDYLKLLEDTSVRERLLEENWGVIETTSTEGLIQTLHSLVGQLKLL